MVICGRQFRRETAGLFYFFSEKIHLQHIKS
ncbi:none [Lactococcus cremoris subsp. cremoris MG1363]|uniref:None n=1 Tax=Lactococcus lactis subsp. cremoris (strain MG1363) TaxID=416870 RepID=A2RN89_LACLM|nr:none [Lactococcus cremoris subsp. cremoris MG1363]